MGEGTDAESIARALGGDLRAFEGIVTRYQRLLYSIALRIVGDREDARDMTQSTFLKVHANLGSYDAAQPFSAWICRILVNESLNLRQRNRRRATVAITAEPVSSQDPEKHLEDRELRERLREGLNQLPAEQREVVVLRHFAELSYREMAAALDLPEKTVKSRLFAGRRRLAGLLGEASAQEAGSQG